MGDKVAINTKVLVKGNSDTQTKGEIGTLKTSPGSQISSK